MNVHKRLGKCSKCGHAEVVCKWCGRCQRCSARPSLLNPLLCADCAGDPSFDTKSPYWVASNVNQAKYYVPGTCRGVWDSSLAKVLDNDCSGGYSTAYETLWQRIFDERRDYLDTFFGVSEFVDLHSLEIDDEQIWEILEADTLEEWLSENHGIKLYEWLSDDVNFDMEFLLKEAREEDDDIDLALSLGLYDKSVTGIFGTLREKAAKAKLYSLSYSYLRMEVLLGIEPEELELNDYGEVSVDELDNGGICPNCESLIPNLVEIPDEWEGESLCADCGSEVSVRQITLMWLHKRGRLTEPLNKILDPANAWIIWPEELNIKTTPQSVLGEETLKEIDQLQ